ncbi:MAG: hypothetical protein A3D31_08125 [Candidatus Fluviicola riflensis]|nr:MAG: hypothetical protein CHH17_06880 [Candidatus Fluviicola riflensis]OGS79907.1 MAG: hypothetical protein A3D31_08125 [Candidatus Fluviicola riflensis]OGS82422.1 MAG: hypothetical protein A2724_17070 [Fluviicola sp. RIFCSPHIGHO2_01_FULL_43_53]OGS88086.1 MAG: hypothetical protein A3E30_14505 [Fluviicola sp. RIFCSPHIGHO2_12_FULL_43_24]
MSYFQPISTALLLLAGCSLSAFAQTNSCNDNAGGEITVNNSCTISFFDIDHNNDYWDGAAGCGATDVDATWGWFTAASTSTTIVYDPVTAGFDPIVTIFSGACATNMTAITCANAAGSDGTETIVLPTVIGQQYRIRVQGSDNSNWAGDLCVYNTVPTAGPGSNTTCVTPSPICSGSPISFIANEGGADASAINPGNDYDCLFTSPNPSWYYLEIDQSGNLVIDITAGSDVDYEIWGPFPSLATAQSQCNTYGAPEDCSYSSSAIEQAVVNGVASGEVYVLLVTNYANTVQTININEAGSNTASTNCGIVLPVGYSNWDAMRINDQVQLIWSTEFEQNNAKFYVQRSETGMVWETIGAVNGKGNSDNENDYSFTDTNPFETVGYYRLMQVDFDGTASHTTILSVAGSTENSLKIYPNPAVNSFTIKTNGSKIDEIILADIVGKTYPVDYTVEDNRVVVNCGDYASGSYTLTVISNGIKMTERLLVQK